MRFKSTLLQKSIKFPYLIDKFTNLDSKANPLVLRYTLYLVFILVFCQASAQQVSISTGLNTGWQITRQAQPVPTQIPTPLPDWITNTSPALPGPDWSTNVQSALLASTQSGMPAQMGADPIWIVYDNCDYTDDITQTYAYNFRRPFYIQNCKAAKNAKLKFTADNMSRVFINGQLIIPAGGPFSRPAFNNPCDDICGKSSNKVSSSHALNNLSSDNWSNIMEVDVTTLLKPGENLIAIEGINYAGCGLNFAWIMARLDYELYEPGFNAHIIDVSPETCKNKGSISINYTFAGTSVTYSLNGGPANTSGLFDNLSAGQYPIRLSSNTGCDTTINVSVPDSVNHINLRVVKVDSLIGCINNNSYIELDHTFTYPGAEYYFDGQNAGSQNRFGPLSPGLHTVFVSDTNGCTSDTVTFNVAPRELPQETAVNITPKSCTTSGAVEVRYTSLGPVMYSLDGGPFQASGTFEPLEPGSYILEVKDTAGCTVMRTIEIADNVHLINLWLLGADTMLGCNDDISFAEVEVKAPVPVTIFVDNEATSFQQIIPLDTEGPHLIWATDGSGCYSDTLRLDVENDLIAPRDTLVRLFFCEGDSILFNGDYYQAQEDADLVIQSDKGCDSLNIRLELRYLSQDDCRDPCEVFIPNVFSPNHDGINDHFEVMNGTGAVTEMYLYNRWGAEIFHDRSDSPKWDGTFKGKPVDPGVYIYVINGLCRQQKPFTKKGSVTLIR